jgi:formate hydrogenlyase subunit 3/multisubunit Na+/H+ antiporter MnhD subunit
MNAAIEWSFLLLGTRFGATDPITRAFLLLTSAVWLAAAVSARSYLAGDPRRARFHGFFYASLSGNVGLVLAQDVVSFYLFFGLMTFAAYGLVVHDPNQRARRAGAVYFVLAFVSELLLLSGFLLVVHGHGNLALEDAPRAVADSPYRDLIVALLLLGFGVKAGALPLHVWLPLAHPVAPTPASAALSGAMIKAGLIGWLRLLPLGEVALPQFGLLCALLGLLAALGGAAVGSTQRDPKTVLAYSSISQMGLMTIALGVALAVPERAAAARAAIAFFAIHHALAKGALFLGVAVVQAVPAGFARRAVLAGLAFSALEIAGAPGTSGALGKLGLHDVLAGAPGVHGLWAAWLSIAAAGSTLLMIRFLDRVAQLPQAAHGPARGLLLPWLALLAFDASLLALFPQWTPAPLGVLVQGNKVVQAFWPLLAGAALAATVRALVRRTRRSLPEIPPGDLLVLAERLAAGPIRAFGALLSRLRSAVSERPAQSPELRLRRVMLGTLRAMQRGQARLAGFATTGWLAGILLLVFVALLVVRR